MHCPHSHKVWQKKACAEHALQFLRHGQLQSCSKAAIPRLLRISLIAIPRFVFVFVFVLVLCRLCADREHYAGHGRGPRYEGLSTHAHRVRRRTPRIERSRLPCVQAHMQTLLEHSITAFQCSWWVALGELATPLSISCVIIIESETMTVTETETETETRRTIWMTRR